MVHENCKNTERIALRGRYSLSFIGLGFLAVIPAAEPRQGHDMENEYDVSIWMPLYCDRYLLDTEEMSGTEAKAYTRILVRLWKSGGYLPNNTKYLQKLSGVSPNYFNKIWEKIRKYFENNDKNIFINSMLKELSKAKKNKVSASNKGKKGAEARWGKNAPANSPSNNHAGKGTGKGKVKDPFTDKEIEKFISGVDLL